MTEPYSYTFTVFTPTYNRAYSLARVRDSLRAQTFRDFEWLIVDDGSTDGTAEMVASWQEEFPLRFLRQEHGGKTRAHNLGVQEARGELFLCLDSDDACVPEALERFARYWQSIPEHERGTYSGLCVLCMDQFGEIVGDPFPQDVIDSNSVEMRVRYAVQGDKWGFVRTDVLKRFPFPTVAGYAGHLPESLAWGQISRHYRERYVNDPLRIFWRDRRSDRLSMNSDRSRDALGLMLWLARDLDFAMRWMRNSPVPVLKDAAYVTRYGLHARAGLRQQYCALATYSAAGLWLLMFPAGCALYALDRTGLTPRIRTLLRRRDPGIVAQSSESL